MLALTGLTPPGFELLVTAFARASEHPYPPDRTLTGRPRQRSAGAGRRAVLAGAEQKLLFLLVYLKTYPLQVVLAELFGLSPSRVNYRLHRLLPVLRDALDDLGVLPGRDPRACARTPAPPQGRTRRIIDGTEHRRRRPKSPEKQRAHYSGRKKAPSDKNGGVASADGRRIDFLSRTDEGRVSDKSVAEQEGIAYPPGIETLALWNEKVRDFRLLGEQLEVRRDEGMRQQWENLLREINDIGSWINAKQRGQQRAATWTWTGEAMLTVKTAALRAGVSAALVYGWCNAGLLAHHRLGLPGHRGCIRIAEADLEAFLLSQKREGAAGKPAAPSPQAGQATASSSAFLSVSFR